MVDTKQIVIKMDEEKIEDTFINKRLQNVMDQLAKFKIDYFQTKEESKKLKEMNTKLTAELKEFKELEKSHRYHLQNSREMIGNLQDTVSQLVYLKRDGMKLNDEIVSKNAAIAALEKDKENMINRHNEILSELRCSYEAQINEIKCQSGINAYETQHHADVKIAQLSCEIEELKNKLNETKAQHIDKINMIVMEYEEKIQESEAKVAQLQEQLTKQIARNDANIDAYRQKVVDLEDKLKQCKFKEVLNQSIYPSQCDIVERPYSRGSYADTSSTVPSRDIDSPRSGINYTMRPNKSLKTTNSLQIQYGDGKTPLTNISNVKKGQFNIVKKRKLYTEKGFQDS